MPARGRGCPISQGEQLRRPGQMNEEGNPALLNLIDNIISIKSPDDIQVSKVAMELKDAVKKNEDLQYCVTELCNRGLRDRTCSPVIAKVFGLTAQHVVGDCKVLSLLLRRVQAEYERKDELIMNDRKKFVTSALFLGEVFHHVQSEKKTPFKVLADPVLKYLDMIIKPHLSKDQGGDDVDNDMGVVSKQNGVVLYEFNPEGVLKLVQDVTEVMCRRELSMSIRVNLLTALAELWPLLISRYNARTIHAQLANRLEVSLKI